jgi:hypothetical protein
VAQACNTNTQEIEAGDLQIQGQPGLNSKTLSQKQTKNNIVYI